jgi:hypothetical protein
MSSSALPFTLDRIRLLGAVMAGARRAVGAMLAARSVWIARREARRQHEALLELPAQTLADIGAPEWLRSQARAHQASEALRRGHDRQAHARWE